jgi:hypothetical protein
VWTVGSNAGQLFTVAGLVLFTILLALVEQFFLEACQVPSLQFPHNDGCSSSINVQGTVDKYSVIY